MVAGHQINPLRDPYDWYPTDPGWTNVLMRHCTLPLLIHEPCAGDGAISDVLINAGHTVVSTDIKPRRPQIQMADALSLGRLDCVVTNPPYGSLGKLVPHWLNTTNLLCLLVRLNFVEAKSRIAWTSQASKVIVVAGRMKVFGKTSQFPHAWVVWDKSNRKCTELIVDSV